MKLYQNYQNVQIVQIENCVGFTFINPTYVRKQESFLANSQCSQPDPTYIRKQDLFIYC